MNFPKARILVVDDSESMLVFLDQVLQRESYEVLTAASGTEAWQILQTQPVNLVITDMFMPAPDGLELMRLAHELHLSVPFIAISGQPGPLNKFVRAHGLGAHISLPKPFTRDRLIEVVQAVLDFNRANRRSQPAVQSGSAR